MAYTSDSAHSPKVNSGDIDTGLISRVKNNPFHPTATAIGWPNTYDAFVTKTDDQQSSVSVTDETHIVAEVDTGSSNALYLEHRPKLGTTFTILGDTAATIDTGATDYTHGVIYFNAMPTGDFTVQYLADPDKYYGEYLTQIQDSIHEIQNLLGAGGAINEGAKNAEYWLDSVTGNIAARLGNAVQIRSINRDIAIKSASTDTTGHDITLGNSQDNVKINAATFDVYRGTTPGTNITVNLTDETGDDVFMAGLVHVSPTGVTRNPAFNAAAVATGLTDATRDSGLYDAMRIYGNLYVAGRATFLGPVDYQSGTITSQMTVVNDDFTVNGDTFLGDSSVDSTYIAGDLTISGGLTQVGAGGEDATFNRNIVLGNTAGISTVDGLDPSYIAFAQQHMRPSSPDWQGDCINQARMKITVEDDVETGGYESTTTDASYSADVLVDSGATGSSLFNTAIGGSGFHYGGRYDDGTWFAHILSGPDEGSIVRVASFNTGNDTWVLSRALSTSQAAGVSYRIQNPYFCNTDFLSATPTSITIVAATTYPVLGNVHGYIKKRTSNYANIAISTDDTHYVYMNLDPSTGMLEGPAEFNSNTYGIPSDQSILVGEVTRAGSAITDTTCYRPNLKYDSTWRYISTSPSGTELTSAADNTFYHNLGGNFRKWDYNIKVYFAPNVGGAPDLTTVNALTPDNITGSAESFSVTNLTDTTLALRLPSPGGYWVRVVATV